MEGRVVTARRLPSGDTILTTDNERTWTKWLANHKWLAVFAAGARVKRREFVVLAHGSELGRSRNQHLQYSTSVSKTYIYRPLLRSYAWPRQRSFSKQATKLAR